MSKFTLFILTVSMGAVPVLAQSFILEDFQEMTALRQAYNAAGLGPIFIGQNDTTAGSNTVCTLNTATHLLDCVPQAQGGGPVPNGTSFWFISLTVNSSSGYDTLPSYMQSYALSGTPTSGINRLRLIGYCDASVTRDPTGHGNWEFGDYVRNIADTSGTETGQGQHYYHNLYGNIYANRWFTIQLNRKANHIVGSSGNYMPPIDPEFNAPTLDAGLTAHYFVDSAGGMSHWYLSGAYLVDNAHYIGTTCHFGTISLSTTANEPDAWFPDVSATYNGTAYEVTWGAPKVLVNGAVYEMYYSSSDAHVAGLSASTADGTITSADDIPYQGTLYTTPSMAEQPKLFVQSRPRMRIVGVSNTNPARISTFQEHGLATGDSVALAGLMGGTWGTALNGTSQTITAVPYTHFRTNDGTLTHVVVSGGGTVTTTTTGSAHGLAVGQVVQFYGGGDLDHSGYPVVITSVPSSTTFQTTLTGASDGTYSSINELIVYDSFTIPVDATGFGTWTYSNVSGAISGTGTATATSDTKNFAQIAIDKVDGTSSTLVFGGAIKFGGAVTIGGHQ